jgi:hypothetical protein
MNDDRKDTTMKIIRTQDFIAAALACGLQVDARGHQKARSGDAE